MLRITKRQLTCFLPLIPFSSFHHINMAERSPSRLSVMLTVGFHISTALAVTIINKTVLNTLPVPVMLLLCQSIMSIGFVMVASALKLYTLPKLDRKFIRGVSPLLAMKVIAQVSKTYCLLVRRLIPSVTPSDDLKLTRAPECECIFLPDSKRTALTVYHLALVRLSFENTAYRMGAHCLRDNDIWVRPRRLWRGYGQNIKCRDHVGGLVVYDDGSRDGTREISCS